MCVKLVDTVLHEVSALILSVIPAWISRGLLMCDFDATLEDTPQIRERSYVET